MDRRPTRRRSRRENPTARANEDDFLIRVTRDSPALRVDQPVMKFAQADEVRQVGRAAPNPPSHMMGIGEDRVRTAREATTAIPAPDLPTLCAGRAPMDPTLVHGVPIVVVDSHDKRGIAHQPPHRLQVQKPATLQIADQLRRVAPVVDQVRKRHMEHRKVRVPWLGPARPARGAGAKEPHEGVVLPMVPARFTIAGQRLGLRLDCGPHLNETLRRETAPTGCGTPH